MSSRIAFPYLTFGDETVTSSSWLIAISDHEPAPMGEYLPDWDYSVSIRLTRQLAVNWQRAADDLAMETTGLVLAAVLRVGTGSGRMPRSIIHQARQPLTAENPTVEFGLTLRGDRLSNVVDLATDIVLIEASQLRGELSPSRAGDRVWRDNARIRLEGEEPRFPIEIADFNSILGNSAAAHSPWYLHWSPRDWSRDFHGSMRLYLNKKHKDLIARVESEDTEILRSLMADVMGQVCESLVRDPDADTVLESCEEGSLGSQARRWLALAFPGRDLDQARSIIESRPGEFRAAFQAISEQREEA